MIKVGSIWKRVGNTWDVKWVGLPVVVVFIDDSHSHDMILYRYPDPNGQRHDYNRYNEKRFLEQFELVEDVCQT